MTSMSYRQFRVLPERFSIHQLQPRATVPLAVFDASMYSIVRTSAGLTIVVPEEVPIDSMATQAAWRVLGLMGPLDFALTGILADLTGVLAEAQVSVFALSTYDTDWVLVRARDLAHALTALKAAGYVEQMTTGSAA